MCECSCLCLLVVILPLGIIDHFTVLLLLIAVLKGCGDDMFFFFFVPHVLEDARKVFDNIPEWNVVLRSNMNVGYAMNNGILDPSSSGCGLDQD